ncbi:MAG TPA: NAD(P)-dependent oxidoreductase [bacterium]
MEIANLVTHPFGIGEKLILELMKQGETVHTVYASPKDVPMSLLGKPRLKWGFYKFEGDKDLNMEKGLPRKVETVFHIFDLYGGSIPRLMMANTMTTVLLLDWAKKVGAKQFIFVSTGEVYGNGRACSETTPYNPRSAYATTKFQSEIISRYYSRSIALKTVRLFFPFGKGMNQGYIHNLVESVKTNGTIETEYGTITPTYADDVIGPLIKVRGVNDVIGFNFCGNPMAVADVVKVIEGALNKTAKKVVMGKAELTGNNAKARELLGFRETPFDQAVRQSFGS